MSDDAPDSLIPYDEIVQEALRAVVGRVLGQIEQGGGELPGGHHFYITFKTHANGVEIPQHLRERFPDEMTIVLQNKFWDLNVDDDGFTVGLSFNNSPAKLDIPFAAITAFVDPAVDFGLQFQAAGADDQPEPHEEAENDGSADAAAAELAREASVATTEDGSNVVTVDFGRKK
ncbi:SspB family protein [Paraurantiacibacter namhicola]|uniref:Stringent starvation protein B n=1 Tax=Paraurantiacibacter namhicola TaxID=645517 RepID=A0A1C7D7J2_9SPHN|nr:ClpXP protease specificity-enhancing factor SspB [Paraurantiacibacter namhicola]ANU07291.1 Stringent starvation protein B [Paraurantiacibacter namhicola]